MREENWTDEELIEHYRDGDAASADILITRYKGEVLSRARTMYILGGDNDDLVQEGMLGLFKAVRDFDCGRDANFHTFARLCINRQLYTAVQSSHRDKHLPLNTALSFDEPAGSASEEIRLVDTLVSGENDPADFLIDEENLRILEEEMNASLSALEKQVLELFMTGMNYVEIAQVLGRTQKSTDNALQRAKGKVKKILSRREEEEQ